MPFQYRIEVGENRVYAKALGVVTFDDAVTHFHKLRQDPQFKRTFSQFFDFTEVERLSLSSTELFEIAKFHNFEPGTKRAFVVQGAVNFGLAKMYDSYISAMGPGMGIRIFTTAEAAMNWLDGVSDTHEEADSNLHERISDR